MEAQKTTQPVIVHDVTISPYAPGAGPDFHIVTWYGGVSVGPAGQAIVKLGYRLEMAGQTVISCPVGKEDYMPSPTQPFETESALAFLMGYLTNEFLIGDLMEKASSSNRALLESYKPHLGPLWDAVVARYGEEACYGQYAL